VSFFPQTMELTGVLSIGAYKHDRPYLGLCADGMSLFAGTYGGGASVPQITEQAD
jgi:hypothetical protein